MASIWNQPLTPDPQRFQWGSRVLWVHAATDEVRVAASGGDEPLADAQVHGEPAPDEPPDTQRFARAPGDEVLLSARTADRAVIVRPATVLSVLAGATASIYVSTPLWVGLRRSRDPEPFFEVPTHRPSNTWFGDTPQAGELAYSTRTLARSAVERLLVLPGRAHTRITLENTLTDPWEVIRMKVPVPHLSLYETPSGLWTSSVRIRRGQDAVITIEDGAPREVGTGERIGGPRIQGIPHLALLALGSLRWS